MKEIERFTFEAVSAIGPYMGSNPNGQWCRWEEVASRIAEIESAVKLMAECLEQMRVQREYERINKLCPGGCVSDGLEQAAAKVLGNPTAKAAIQAAKESMR